jgi:CRISPR-associated endonuclease/helicase Cas3
MTISSLPFWAKTLHNQPGISVRDHSMDVGSVAQALVARLPEAANFSFPGASTLASLHDVGKICPGFQAKCEAWITNGGLEQAAIDGRWRNGCETDHAKVSQWVLQKLLADEDFFDLAMMLGAHHGKIKGSRLTRHSLSGSIGDEQWDQWRLELAHKLISHFGPVPERISTEAELWWTAGLVTVADWIASGETAFFPADGSGTDADRPARVEAALDAIHWRTPEIRSGLVFTDLFPFPPRKLQQAAMEIITKPGVYLIEGPMGCGKTEAALAASYGLLETKQASGLYFALPTQITSNAIHKRLQTFLNRVAKDPEQVRLAHGAAWMQTDEYQFENTEARRWFASAKRALLLPFGVGTIDQALLGMIAVKHFFLRQFALGGKVVILDEVHTYDLYTGTLLDKLVQRLRELGCTAIILSATVTSQRRNELGAVSVYPSYDGMPRSTVRAATTAASDAELAAICLERARAGQCVLWVRNTVRDAQNSYRSLQEAGADVEIGLLHSRFPLWRREELEDHWLTALGKDSANRPPGCVLVATQIVEQSLDIDADFMVADLAPTDMLLQRIGRLWRNQRAERTGEPEVLINVCGLTLRNYRDSAPEELKRLLDRSAHIYAPYVLLRSYEQWIRCSQLSLPEDIKTMIEATYASTNDDPASWDQLRQKLQEDGEELRAQAVNAALVRRQAILEDDERAVTRVTDIPTVPLLLCAAEPETVRGRTRISLIDGTEVSVTASKLLLPEAKKIHRNLVKVPFYVADRTIETPEWLKEYVSSSAVLGVVADGGVIASGVLGRTTWDREFGVTLPHKED